MRKLRAGVVGVVGALLVAALVPPTAAARPHSPKVICITSYRLPRGAYRYKPHHCVFHQRHKFPITGANTVRTKDLHWKHWTQRSAAAKGEVLVSTIGPSPASLKLTRPRTLCGKTVFTRLRVRFRFVFNGHTYYRRFKMSIDNCLGLSFKVAAR
jgi:hypothetical protein